MRRADIEMSTVVTFILLIIGIVLLALLINGLSGNMEAVSDMISEALEDFL